MINYKQLFYLISSITVLQEYDFTNYTTGLTPNQFVTDAYIKDTDYEYNKEIILQLK